MRKSVVGLLAAALLIPAAASAQGIANPWTVRARAIAIVPNAESDPEGLDVKSDFTAEIDISYRFHPLLSAELVLATAGHEVVADDGDGNELSLGSVNILPPSLLAQFHIPVKGSVQPYVGAGVNMTMFYAKSGALEEIDLSTSFGFAGQLGIDFMISERALFNVDAKYVTVKTELDGGPAELEINPFIFGVGFGYRF